MFTGFMLPQRVSGFGYEATDITVEAAGLQVFRLHMSFCIAGVVEFLAAHGAGEAPAGVRRHHALDRVIQHPCKSHGSRRSRVSGIRLGHVIYFQV